MRRSARCTRTIERGRDPARHALARPLPLLVALAIVSHAAPVRADDVDRLIGQLEDGSDKIRLSAALNLTKLADPRAILALAKRVNVANESDKNVRSAAALGLGRLVTASTKANIKKVAVSGLERAAADDPSDVTKQQARQALGAITGRGAETSPGVASEPGGGIYVNIGPMSSRTGADDAQYRTMMVKVATTTMGKVASDMPTTWPGGVPTKSVLDTKGVQGFYIDGTLNELKLVRSSSSSTVSCKVSMLVASFPDKNMFGFLDGGAKVQASAKRRDVELAREDCVSAVVEDLVATKIVPTIKTRAGHP